jgi:hypothetical protein
MSFCGIFEESLLNSDDDMSFRTSMTSFRFWLYSRSFFTCATGIISLLVVIPAWLSSPPGCHPRLAVIPAWLSSPPGCHPRASGDLIIIISNRFPLARE